MGYSSLPVDSAYGLAGKSLNCHITDLLVRASCSQCLFSLQLSDSNPSDGRSHFSSCTQADINNESQFPLSMSPCNSFRVFQRAVLID